MSVHHLSRPHLSWRSCELISACLIFLFSFSLSEFEAEYQELWDWLMDMESIVTDSHDLMMSEEQRHHLYKVNGFLLPLPLYIVSEYGNKHKFCIIHYKKDFDKQNNFFICVQKKKDNPGFVSTVKDCNEMSISF
uniref:Uncharacterized protein n=1 Tax=Cyprinus carpio TaxID=7962 RepID=A0A8C1Z800_CYPCA